jgi:hypothetical protein
VRVSAEVLEGIDAVALSGETDMNDTLEIQALAFLMGYPEAAWWIDHFPNLYVAGLVHGFAVEVPPSSNQKSGVHLLSGPYPDA